MTQAVGVDRDGGLGPGVDSGDEVPQQRARIDEVDASGYTPLMFAAMSNPDPAVITSLVAAGASVDARGPNQGTALMFAAKFTKKSAVVQALIDAHANMKLKDAAGKTAFDYATGNSALMFSSQLAALGFGRF